jgi:hypothetical protein
LVTEGTLGERGDPLFAHFGRGHFVRHRPFVEAARVMRHLHPEDPAARLADRRGKPIDRGHDIARRGADRVPDFVVHKRVLQIDHDECGARGIEIGIAVLAAAPGDHPIDDRLRNAGAVQFHLPPPCC